MLRTELVITTKKGDYKYIPKEDITLNELTRITQLLITLLTANDLSNAEIGDFVEEHNLIRHFERLPQRRLL
jgi:hypothetical protein